MSDFESNAGGKPGECVSVHTAKWFSYFVDENGSGWWVCVPGRVQNAKYLLIVHNDGPVEYERRDTGPGPHNHITMVGRKLKITGSTKDTHSGEMRYVIGFEEYALLPVPVMKPWSSGHNPVRYWPVAQVPIDFDSLDWRPFSEMVAQVTPAKPEAADLSAVDLIQLLAPKLGYSTDALMRKIMAA